MKYAMLLAKSVDEDKRKAIKLFQELVDESKLTKETLYHLALTFYALKDFIAARFNIEELLRIEPDQVQVKARIL